MPCHAMHAVPCTRTGQHLLPRFLRLLLYYRLLELWRLCCSHLRGTYNKIRVRVLSCMMDLAHLFMLNVLLISDGIVAEFEHRCICLLLMRSGRRLIILAGRSSCSSF